MNVSAPRMRFARWVLLVSLGLASTTAMAEYCWMLGCQNEIGYLPIRPTIFGAAQLKGGATAKLANYAYLRQQAIEEARGIFVLGPGTEVKVLELITLNGSQFAIVRVVKDANTRKDECKSTITCRATFY